MTNEEGFIISLLINVGEIEGIDLYNRYCMHTPESARDIIKLKSSLINLINKNIVQVEKEINYSDLWIDNYYSFCNNWWKRISITG